MVIWMLIYLQTLQLCKSEEIKCSANCNSLRGNEICNPECMNELCGFDIPANVEEVEVYELSEEEPLTQWIEYLKNSECYSKCLTSHPGCTPDLLGNYDCDAECNYDVCGWDWGDCGYCSKFCYEIDLKELNSSTTAECSEECFVAECGFLRPEICDCKPLCTTALLTNDVCDSSCNTSGCFNDNGNCICSKCLDEYRYNDKCDPVCNKRDCDYEEHDLCYTDSHDPYCAEYCPYKNDYDATVNDEIDTECWTLGCSYLTADKISKETVLTKLEEYTSRLRYNFYMQLIYSDMLTVFHPETHCLLPCETSILLDPCQSECSFACTTEQCKNACTNDCKANCTTDECKAKCTFKNCMEDCTTKDCQNACIQTLKSNCTTGDCTAVCTFNECIAACPNQTCINSCSEDCTTACTTDIWKAECSLEKCTEPCTTDECRARCNLTNCKNNCPDRCKLSCINKTCGDLNTDGTVNTKCKACINKCEDCRKESVCNESCNTKECAYDLGRCSTHCHKNCSKCFGSKEDECLECNENFQLLGSECISYSSVIDGFISFKIPQIDVDIYTLDVFTGVGVDSTNPLKLYVYKPVCLENLLAQEYNSITKALSFAYMNYNIIYISKSTEQYPHLLKPSSLNDSLSSPKEPYTFNGIATPKITTIMPKYCTDVHTSNKDCVGSNDPRPVVNWSGLEWITIEVMSGTLHIIGIDLRGKNLLTKDCADSYELYAYSDSDYDYEYDSDDCESTPEIASNRLPSTELPEMKYCEYCHNFNINGPTIITDKGEGLDDSYNYCEEWVCNEYKDKSLFIVKGKLKLENVKIYDWRSELKSIILNTKGDIELENVDFYNIIISSVAGSGVIVSTVCDKNSYNCGSILYKKGIVSLLNNGFEYSSNLEFSGFLMAKGTKSIKIESVTFELNMAYIGEKKSIDQAGLGTLIYATNFRQFIISGCTFDQNHVTNGLISLGFVTVLEEKIDSNKKLTDIEMVHIDINNSLFNNNYGRVVGGILIVYRGEHLNSTFKSLIFKQNVVKDQAMISVYLTGTFSKDWIETKPKKFKVYDKGFKEIYVTFPKRYTELSDIIFDDNFLAGNGAIYVDNLANLSLKNVSINSSQERVLTVDYREKYVHEYFIKGATYITKNIIKPSTTTNLLAASYNPDFNILGLITNTRGISLSELTLSNNYSKKGNTNFIIKNAYSFVSSEKIVILNNACNDSNYGSGLSIESIDATVTINSFTATNNANSHANGYGPLYVNSKSTSLVTLTNSVFTRNSAAIGAAASILFKTAKLSNLRFQENEVKRLYGGLYLASNGELATCTLSVSNSYFVSNKVTAGNGGSIAIDYLSVKPTSVLEMTISNSQFQNNNSLESSAVIFVSSTVRFSTTSIISDCSFVENSSISKANIMLKQVYGVLTFKSCQFNKNSSTQGIAIYVVAPNVPNIPNKVVMDTCTFSNNVDTVKGIGSVIQLADTSVYSVIESKYCSFYDNQASSVGIEYGEWTDSNSIYFGNKAVRGAVLHIMTNSKATVTSATIYSNSVTKHGAVASISSQSVVTIKLSKIYSNIADEYGGVIFIDQESIITLQEDEIYQNQAKKKASVIYSIGCDSDYSYVKDSFIYNNSAYSEGTFNLISSFMKMTNTKMHENTTNLGPMNIVMTLSKLEMLNCEVYNQKGTQGGVVFASSMSSLIIQFSNFRNISITGEGGCIFALTSSVVMENTSLDTIKADSGGAIFLYTSSTLLISSSRMNNIAAIESGGLIKASESVISISKTAISNYSSGGIDATKLTSLLIADSEIADGQGVYGGALYCSKCKKIDIKSSVFINITASEGGALYLTTELDSPISANYTITSSKFYNNTANNGGAILTDNVKLVFKDNIFEGNGAKKLTAHKDAEYGCGGGLYLKCTVMDDCTYYLNSNQFKYNSAERKGGSVYWTDVMPKTDSKNTFFQNTAVYAADIASYPVAIAMVDETGQIISAPDLKKRKMTDDQVIATASSIASGQNNLNWVIRAAIIDHYSNIIRTDSSSFAELEPTSENTAISGISRVQSNQGIFTFNSFKVTAPPGTKVIIDVRSDAIDTTKHEKAADEIVYYENVGIDVDLRDCVPGESQESDVCYVCPYPMYSLTPTQECSECPSEAECYGNYTMIPKPGYWRVDEFTDQFFKCFYKEACLGSPDYPDTVSYSGECLKGYRGHLCQACDAGYSRSSKNKCGGCPSKTANIVKLVGVMIAAIGVIAIMIRSTMNSAYKPKSVQSIYIKILMNYLQLVMLAASFELSWPDQVLEIFSLQETAGSVTDQIFSFDCFMASSDNPDDIDNVYFMKLVIFLIMPALLFLLALIFWSLVACYTKRKKYLKDHLVATIVILLFLIHPNIIKVEFSAFNCFEIEKNEFWLRENLQIKCWDSKHTTYALCIALPAIAVWGLGLPTVCLFFLYKYRKSIHTINLKLKLGFLYNGYNSKYFFWEFVVLYRKISIICCSVFLVSISVHIQALTVMLVLFFFLFVQTSNNPYTHKSMNDMEVRSILVSTVTIYCGLYYLTNELENDTKFGFFLVILGINIYFLYFWMNEMMVVVLDILTRLMPCIRQFRKKLYDGFGGSLFVDDPLYDNVVKRGGEDFCTLLNKEFDDKPNGVIDMTAVPNLDRKMVDIYLKRVEDKNNYFDTLKQDVTENLTLMSVTENSPRKSETLQEVTNSQSKFLETSDDELEFKH